MPPPRAVSLACAPLLVAAYAGPLGVAHQASAALASAVYAVPACLVTGEIIAWTVERLQRRQDARRAGEERFRSLVLESADVVLLLDAEARVTFASPSLERVLGYQPRSWIGCSPIERVSVGDRGRMAEILGALRAAPGRIERLDVRVQAADGSVRTCALVLRNLLEDPSVSALVVSFGDITERVAASLELAESEHSFRRLFDSNPQPMWVCDRHGQRFLAINQAALSHYGYGIEAMTGLRLADLDLERPLGEEPDQFTRSKRHHLVADGRDIVVELSSRPITFQGTEAILVCAQDVTDREVLEAQLRHQAFHDSLTNLANRALFMDRVAHALTPPARSRGALALILFDLDGFKNVNDSLGHSAGDALLGKVAERLRATLRPGDTAARLGGDEFAVLLEDASGAEGAKGLAERLVAALESPFSLGVHEVVVKASFGIAVPDPDRPTSAEELIRNADAAMYGAKASGKGRYSVFEQHMHAAALARLEVDAELRVAVTRGELELYYQPQVLLPGGRVEAAEALIRWNHPTRGLLGPADFIHVSEETGMAVEIGRWALEAACGQLARWRGGRGPSRVSLNLSPRQVSAPDFVDSVARALRQSGADPASLTLELTEDLLMGDTRAALRALGSLRRLGVRIALDDFGTGYSSLSYLRRFPMDYLKIDTTFVEGLGTEPEATSLVAGIIGVAEALGLTVVAEGVETEVQAAVLTRLGCRHAQGFLFGRPVPAANLTTHGSAA